MKYTYKTCGVCAKQIDFVINEQDGTVDMVEFLGGCDGNLKGISILCKGSNSK